MEMLAAQICPVMNDHARFKGFSPSQWFLGKMPRRLGSNDEDELHRPDISLDDPESTFFKISDERTSEEEHH